MSIHLASYLICLVVLPGLALRSLFSKNPIRKLSATPATSLETLDNFSKGFVLSLAISFSLVTLSLVYANHQGLNPSTIAISFRTCIVASILVLVLTRDLSYWKSAFSYAYPALIIFAFVFLHQLIFGAYSEIPSDLYAHLERYQAALEQQSNGNFGPSKSMAQLFSQGGKIWYQLIAVLSNETNSSTLTTLSTVVLVTKTLFLTSIYYFSAWVFQKNQHVKLVAGLTVTFVALHFGINIFAFIRYYAFAPVILNFSLYLAAVILICQCLSNPSIKRTAGSAILVLIFVLAATAVHSQEALYILTIAPLLVWAKLAQSYLQPAPNNNSKRVILWLLSLTAIAIFLIAYTYLQLNQERAPNIGWRLWVFHENDGWWPSISTLNMNYQFIRVVTLWGLLVYGLFLLNIRRYKDNIFILAAMFSPIFTILNPFYVDLFLRLANSTTLWRLCYLIPLHYVAADIFLHYLRSLRGRSYIDGGFKVICLVLLIVLLLPMQNTWQGLHYSRIPTLAKIDSTKNYRHLQDLIDYLSQLNEKHVILTDPVTGYVVSALTHHHSYRRKFFRTSYQEFTYSDYSNNPLSRYQGQLLLVNLRSKGNSMNGNLSKHWPNYIFDNIKTFYPPQLLDHLESNPDQFSLLWENDELSLYKILRK